MKSSDPGELEEDNTLVLDVEVEGAFTPKLHDAKHGQVTLLRRLEYELGSEMVGQFSIHVTGDKERVVKRFVGTSTLRRGN
jgi:hypothetical protein